MIPNLRLLFNFVFTLLILYINKILFFFGLSLVVAPNRRKRKTTTRMSDLATNQPVVINLDDDLGVENTSSTTNPNASNIVNENITVVQGIYIYMVYSSPGTITIYSEKIYG